jgi:hypothetical protein
MGFWVPGVKPYEEETCRSATGGSGTPIRTINNQMERFHRYRQRAIDFQSDRMTKTNFNPAQYLIAEIEETTEWTERNLPEFNSKVSITSDPTMPWRKKS